MIRYLLLFLYTFSPMAVFGDGIWTTYINNSIDLNDISIEKDHIWCTSAINGAVQCVIHEMSFTALTSNEDLLGNEIYSVAVDRNGVKWFGTRKNGIVSYDGSSWQVYRPWETTFENWNPSHENPVWEIFIDEKNVKLFGTKYGVYRYNDLEWKNMCDYGYGEYRKGIAYDHRII